MMTVVMRWLIAALSVWTMAHGAHLNQPYTVLVLDKQDWWRRLLIAHKTPHTLTKIAKNCPKLPKFELSPCVSSSFKQGTSLILKFCQPPFTMSEVALPSYSYPSCPLFSEQCQYNKNPTHPDFQAKNFTTQSA